MANHVPQRYLPRPAGRTPAAATQNRRWEPRAL